MTKFADTVEYWAQEITAEEKRLTFLMNQYDKNHMRQDWDFQRAIVEKEFCRSKIESLYLKLDDAHRRDAGIYGVFE